MTIWPPDRDRLKRPVYLSLAQCVIDAIDAGEISRGDRLPPHRTLAYDLGLSVQTVSRAYDELRRRGFIEGAVGRGSFVRARAADVHTPWHRIGRSEQVIDCSMLVPVTSDLHAERMAATLADLARDIPPATLFSFRPRATLERHCAFAQVWLADCGVSAPRDRILPTNGNTAAMNVALMTAAQPGDLVVTEAMGHHTLKSLTGALGLRLAGLEMDAEGVTPDAFERACRAGPTKALFLMPNGLNATAAVAGEARRLALVEIARRHDVWIIENDAGGPVQPDRPPPIAALAPERTFYFTGLTKCVLPGLRVAWLIAPEALTGAARNRHLVAHWMATPMIAEIATRWLEDGAAATLLKWQRDQLGRRNALAARRLAGIEHSRAPRGLHVWLPLPEAWREDDFVAHARHDGVAVAAGANFAIDERHGSRGVRVCIGAGSEPDIDAGLAVIARLCRSAPEPALLAV